MPAPARLRPFAPWLLVPLAATAALPADGGEGRAALAVAALVLGGVLGACRSRRAARAAPPR